MGQLAKCVGFRRCCVVHLLVQSLVEDLDMRVEFLVEDLGLPAHQLLKPLNVGREFEQRGS